MTPEDPLDAVEHALREDARHAIADDSFTLRVMQRLPVLAERAPPWFRPTLMTGSALLGAALAYAFAPAGTSFAQGAVALALCGALIACSLVVGNELGSDSN